MDSKEPTATLNICFDCVLFNANGDLPEYCYDNNGEMNFEGAAYLQAWTAQVDGGTLDTCDQWSEGYNEFSIYGCDICPCNRAGERHTATLWHFGEG